MTPTLKAAQAALRQRLLDVPADLRVWARTKYPETYRAVCQLEEATCLLEEMGVREGYGNMATRLIDHWIDLTTIWEADANI